VVAAEADFPGRGRDHARGHDPSQVTALLARVLLPPDLVTVVSGHVRVLVLGHAPDRAAFALAGWHFPTSRSRS